MLFNKDVIIIIIIIIIIISMGDISALLLLFNIFSKVVSHLLTLFIQSFKCNFFQFLSSEIKISVWA